MIRQQLIIFVKAPIMGKAKTRLAADIGMVHAWRIYRSMTASLLRNLTSPSWDITLAVTPANWQGRLPLWEKFSQYAQTEGSLTPRLAQAFSVKAPIVVIGSDCPQVTKNDIRQAFKLINARNIVFGPASDGGFWLMGAQGPVASNQFENIRWSTSNTLMDIQKNFDGSCLKLRMLTDIDDAKSLRHVRRSEFRPGRHRAI